MLKLVNYVKTKSLYRLYHVVKENVLPVELFGSLHISVPYSVYINPSNSSVMKLRVTAPEPMSVPLMFQAGGSDVVLKSHSSMGNKKIPDIRCYLEIPHKFDLDVTVKECGNLLVESMQSTSMNLETLHGDIKVRNITCDTAALSTYAGDVSIEGEMQGNVSVSTGKDGVIRAKKLKGDNISLCCSDGAIEVNALYSNTNCILSNNGHVKLNNLHGYSNIRVTGNGNLHVAGGDGQLRCVTAKGDMDINVSRLSDTSKLSTVHGNISVALVDSVECQLQLIGREVQVNDELANKGELKKSGNQTLYKGGDGVALTAVAVSGRVTVSTTDWATAVLKH